MTVRERTLAVLEYRDCRRLPLIHFGFWDETLVKWAEEGHISTEESLDWEDASENDYAVGAKLGFESTWAACFSPNSFLDPSFEERILERRNDGTCLRLNEEGVIVLDSENNQSIPGEVDFTLKGRFEWETEYKNRLIFHDGRITGERAPVDGRKIPWEAALSCLQNLEEREYFTGLYTGSLIGIVRNILGITGLSYMTVDDPTLLNEIIETIASLAYRVAEQTYASGARFDVLHFWEDICYKSGPLVNPAFYREQAGPNFRRMADLAARYGTKYVSVDCDGYIDDLIPVWVDNGVNLMFPIEVGTWEASIAPWRKRFGRELRGIGGMKKHVFAQDFAAVDAEIERLKPLVHLGGFIPCPDHRIAPDAEWDNVRYYCDRFRAEFG